MTRKETNPYLSVDFQQPERDWLGSFAVRATIGQVMALVWLLEFLILSQTRFAHVIERLLSRFLFPDLQMLAMWALVVLGPLTLAAVTPWRRQPVARHVATMVMGIYTTAIAIRFVGPFATIYYWWLTGTAPR